MLRSPWSLKGNLGVRSGVTEYRLEGGGRVCRGLHKSGSCDPDCGFLFDIVVGGSHDFGVADVLVVEVRVGRGCASFPRICRTVRGLVSMALIRCRGLLLLIEGPGYLAWGCLGYDECSE